MTIDIRVRVWSGKDPFAAALDSSPTALNADNAGIDPSPAGDRKSVV